MTSQNLHIYNTLTGAKEKFTPLEKGKVGMYVCGPTLYDKPHIGNMRTMLNFDLVYRYLKFIGYDVKYVRNITDAGHLEDDSGELVDRVGNEAKRVKRMPLEIVYENNIYLQEIIRKLNILHPTIEPTATGHIQEQIDIINMIMDRGYAYEVNGSVYFDIRKYNEKYDYGILSGRKLEEQRQETRELTAQDEKRYFADFALWKAVDQSALQKWDSPWGVGGPGWHIECTAMSTKYLGTNFDIHGGGIDLKFPHHEGEIAQNCGSFGDTPANVWMHANMLTLNNAKMSKSLGTSIFPDELFNGTNKIIKKAYSPEVVRFFMLMCHYRSELDISVTALDAAETAFKRMTDSFLKIEKLKTTSETSETSEIIDSITSKCYEVMNDDFNSPMLIAELHRLSNTINKVYTDELSATEDDKEKMAKIVDDFFITVLGINFQKSTEGDSGALAKLMDLILKIRKSARENKDWGTSDSIRDTLNEANIQVNDEKEGSTWSFKL